MYLVGEFEHNGQKFELRSDDERYWVGKAEPNSYGVRVSLFYIPVNPVDCIGKADQVIDIAHVILEQRELAYQRGHKAGMAHITDKIREVSKLVFSGILKGEDE